MDDNEISKHDLVRAANKLLNKCKIDKRLNALTDLDSKLLVTIYENICATELVDKKAPVTCIDDEIHNVQSIIDSLSMDILHEDLSHITGEAIMNKDLVSIEYLLDIFKSIHEWISSRIDMDDDDNDDNVDMMARPNVDNNGDDEKTENDGEDWINADVGLVYGGSDAHCKHSLCTDSVTVSSVTSAKYDQRAQDTQISSPLHINTSGPSNLHDLKNFIDSSIMNLNEKIQSQIQISNQAKTKQMNDDWIQLLTSDNDSSRNESTEMAPSVHHDNDNLSVVGIVSEIKRKRQELMDNMTTSKCRQQSPDLSRHVKFENSSTMAKTLVHNTDFSLSASVNEQNVTNELSIIKNGIERITNKDSESIKKLLTHIYTEDYKDAKSIGEQALNKQKRQSKRTNDFYMNIHQSRPVSSSSSSYVNVHKSTKSVLIPDEYKRPLCQKRSSSRTGPAVQRCASITKSRLFIGEDGILNTLLDEFPNLYMSTETIHELWSKHARQLESLANEQRDMESKYLNVDGKSYIQTYLDGVYKKQNLLMDIMRKDLHHMQRKQDLKRKQDAENSLKIHTREQRVQAIKIKRYFEEFHLQQRSKMLKNVTKEEVLFKKLFNESLKIQRERVNEMKRYAKDQRNLNVKVQLNQIESIENFYKNKFQLLNEQLEREKSDTALKEKAQHDVLIKMKSKLKNKLESDIRDLQGQLCKDEDFLYWRHLDADRIKADLKYARYQAKV